MKIFDYLFYITLCIVVGIGLIAFNLNEDMYFSLPTFDTIKTYEVYEKVQWEVKAKKLLAVDIAQIDSARYLISYLNDDEKTSVYSMLFYPNKYSAKLQNGKWQHITTYTKVHSKEVLLFDTEMLITQTKQKLKAIQAMFIQRNGSKLYLFLNAAFTQEPLITRSYIFHSDITDIADYIESEKPSQQKNDINAIFSLHSHPTLSVFAKVNAFLSHKPTQFSSTHHAAQGLILPFYTHIKNDIALFGIFNKDLRLKEIVKPHDNTSYTKPLITPLHTYYDLNNKTNESTTHSCLAIYQKSAIGSRENIQNLAYQTCKVSNGILQFEALRESRKLHNIGGEVSIAALGHYILLLYTDKDNTTLNLAVWNGSDFTPLKELDKNEDGRIISLNTLIHGSYAYIVYGENMHNKINVITLNETYISNLIAANSIIH